MYDVIIIGGGPAGLQAALTLGRMRRSVLLVDSGEYRNETAQHAHNFMTHDGRPPAEIRELARKDISAYPTVEQRMGQVDSVSGQQGRFIATIGREEIAARALILATGMRDTLPPIPGLAQVWGVEAAQCPFCHGYELSDQVIAVHGVGAHTPMFAAMLRNLTSDVVVLPDGVEIDAATSEALVSLGGKVVQGAVRGVERVDGGLQIAVEGADPVQVAGFFVTPSMTQSAPFADQLGLHLLPSGAIDIDAFGHTSVPGVYAAGDLAHLAELPMPMASVLTAAAAGLVAGSTAVRELLG